MKRCKKWLALISAFTFIATSSLIPGTYEVQAATGLAPAAAKTPGNSNPIITHKYGADPYAMVYDGRVYMYLTDDQAQWELTPDTNNSYGNCRSITIVSSADMVNWTDHGKVPVGKQVGGTTWANNAWAPAAAWKTIDGKDKFFLYFADNASGVGVLVGDSPIGPFHDPLNKALINRQETPNVEPSKVPWLFDPAVLVDDDGKAYLYFGGGIDGVDANNPKSSRMVQLGDDMISIVGTPQEIDAPRIFEDSGIHKFNGKYYYSYCSNFSGTNGDGRPPTGTIAYMVSDNPLGPFEYIGPILPGPGVFGNGDGGNNHHAIFEFEGKWYITYHTRQVNIAKRQIEGKSGHRDYRSPSITELSIDNATGLITPLQMENKGVSRLKTMNPYTRVEAETIAWNGEISTEKSTQPGSMVDSINLQVNDIDNGDWIAVSGLDFGDTGAGTFAANVASGAKGGEIELRLDSLEGEVIGTLPVSSTGGWDNWEMMTTAVSGATGVHDLYMIFKGQAEGDLFKVDYWKFNQKSDNHELVSINATIDKQKIDITSGNNTANMKVSAVYADGTSEDVTAQATVTPDQEDIVEINNGLITGVGYGTTSINVSYEGKTYVVYLEVKDLKAEYTIKKLTVDNNKVTLDSGSKASFKVTAEYFDGHTEDVTDRATYNILHSDIADVANGTVTAKASGTTNIIVSFKGELGDAVTTQIYVTVSNLSAPIKFLIKNSNPIFEGPCKVAWGDTIGYFDKGTNGGADGAVTFTVNVPTAGKYKMSVYNVAAWGSATHLYTINGDTNNTIKYTYPSSSTEWKLSPFSQDITLNAGDNTIRIAANSGVAELQYINLQSYSGEDTQVPVAGVSLDKSSISMKAGDVDTLIATVNPSTATDKEVAFVVEGSAVTVAEAVYNENDGTTSVQIKAEKQGSAIVKAYAGGFESICNVTVSEDKVNVTGLILDKSKSNLQVGSTETLVATITPANATNKTVTFASDNEAVATVTGVVYDEVTGTTSVTVNAIALGTATITATTADGNITATCDVVVENLSAPVKYIIRESNPAYEGACGVIYGDVIGRFDKANDGGADGAVTFTVSVPIAGTYKMSVFNQVIWGNVSHLYTINGDTSNVIKYTYPSTPTGWKLSQFSKDITLNAGDNTIKIAYDPAVVSGAAEIQYIELQSYSDEGSEVPVSGVSLNNSALSLKEGSTGTLTATVLPVDATNKTVTFASDNESVATVTGVFYDEVTGTTSVAVNALTAGIATITATTADGNKTATCNVTVTPSEKLKPFTIIADGNLIRDGGIQADVNVNPIQGVATHEGEEAVIFQLMKGNVPVSIPALMRDITSTESIKAYFNVDPTDTSYTVKVFVLDRFDSDVTAPVSLAEPVILK